MVVSLSEQIRLLRRSVRVSLKAWRSRQGSILVGGWAGDLYRALAEGQFVISRLDEAPGRVVASG